MPDAGGETNGTKPKLSRRCPQGPAAGSWSRPAMGSSLAFPGLHVIMMPMNDSDLRDEPGTAPCAIPLELSLAPAESAASTPGEAPWGPWATFCFGAAISLVFLLGQVLPVLAGLLVRSWWDPTGTARPETMGYDGDILGAATLSGGFLALSCIAALAFLRQSRPGRYLKLSPFPWWHLPVALAITYAAGLVQTSLAPWFGCDPIPQFMIDTFRSTDHPLLLGLGIVLMAPLFEECFFRGFLHAGWRRTRLGAWPSILATSLLWTLIHMQYGWFEKSWIFGFGILLSLAREWSGSLWPPIAMHAMNNGLSLAATTMELSAI